MTDIKIKRLVLENFKCHRYLKLEFMGANASIYGDNATGKTSIYDGLTWLLFGKDSQGNGEKNIEVKPLGADGEVVDHDALTAVEAALLVNGDELILRRTYKEVWSTKRGSSVATYDGNTSEYFVDGVPCKRNAFQEKVNELVDEDTFRMLTSVSHFASGISWQERRAVLFQVAGVMDDQQILASNEMFKPLVEAIGKRSLEDYKKKLLAEKKGFSVQKSELPARISECQKTVDDLRDLDVTAAKAELDRLNTQKAEITERIAAIDNDGAVQKKQLEIREVQLELTALENENKAFIDKQLSSRIDIYGLNIRMTALQKQIDGKKKTLDNEKAYLQKLEGQVESARAQWKAVNNETFSGGKCITCGQILPADQRTAAVEKFESDKKRRLDEILDCANRFKEMRTQAENRIAAMEDEIVQMEEELHQRQQQIDEAEAAKTDPKDMDGFIERKEGISKRLDKLNDDLLELMESGAAVKAGLQAEMAALNQQIDRQAEITAKEHLLDYSRRRIAQLREDAKNASECLESIEKMLYLMDAYSRYKTRFVEDSINGCFRIARFRLFREQANGGVEDRCDVVYEGIPYISVNSGQRINLGIDIINTLSRAYGVRVPLFVDNAESVTNLETCDSQIIRLVVSENDKELRVNYAES